MRARQLWLDIERAAVASDRIIESPRFRVGDGEILQHAVIVRLVAQRELIGRQRGIEVALAFERANASLK